MGELVYMPSAPFYLPPSITFLDLLGTLRAFNLSRQVDDILYIKRVYQLKEEEAP